VALPGAKAPTSIALQVIGACRTLHDKAIVLKDLIYIKRRNFSFLSR
jgi:hypothetical protein